MKLVSSMRRALAVTTGIAALSHCAPGSDPRGSPEGSGMGGASQMGQMVPHVPYISAEWVRAFRPMGTRYLNDHSLFRDRRGTWHLIGITHDSDGAPFFELSLLHASSTSLSGPSIEHRDALSSDPQYDEGPLWAPFVFMSEAGIWTMLYSSTTSRAPLERVIRVAESDDLAEWVRTETHRSPFSRPLGGRDPFAIRIGEEWWIYSVGVDPELHGQILLTRSPDLDGSSEWSEPIAVITDPTPSFSWGNLESPFIVEYAGYFYLFLTRTSDNHTDYVRTNVFRSNDPTRFAWKPITDIRAHASEVVQDAEGAYWITSAGWTKQVGELNRGLLVAPLRWAVSE